MDILAKMFQFVKANFNNIILFLLVMLFGLFSFATGYIIAKYQDKEPIKIENLESSI